MVNHRMVFTTPPAYQRSYQRLRKKLFLEMRELRSLIQKNGLNLEEKNRIPILLLKIGGEIYSNLREEIAAASKEPGTMLERENFFKAEFGHPPLYNKGPDRLNVEAACSSNAMVQQFILNELGAQKIGAIFSTNHITPTIKIAGTTYVLEEGFFKDDAVLTLREYLSLIADSASAVAEGRLPFDKSPSKAYVPPGINVKNVQELLRFIRIEGGWRPVMAGIHQNYAFALLLNGRIDESEKECKLAIETMPMAASHLLMGTIKDVQGKPGEGIRECHTALRILPDYAEAHELLGEILCKIGKRAQGNEHLARARKLNPNIEKYHMFMGEKLGRTNSRLTQVKRHKRPTRNRIKGRR